MFMHWKFRGPDCSTSNVLRYIPMFSRSSVACFISVALTVCTGVWQPLCAQDTAGSASILTPPESEIPRITGPRIFGVRPGNPFLFLVTATGMRPMKFSSDHLPGGLSLNADTGLITGALKQKGETTVTLHAQNAKGADARAFRIVCGDAIALTPPLGWNSWNSFGMSVSDAKMRATADAMIKSGLVNHGWSYINIDDGWAGARDAGGNIHGDAAFPDIKALADYIHAKGLKFGIYSSPGPRTCGQLPGSYQHEDQDAKSYAAWDVDYVKYDWCSYEEIAQKIAARKYAEQLPADGPRIVQLLAERAELQKIPKRSPEQVDEFKKINAEVGPLIYQKMNQDTRKRIDLDVAQEPYRVFRASLDKAARDIVFSLCQYGDDNVWEWGQAIGGNCWRTTGDINGTWSRMFTIGERQAGLGKFAGPGHWNDPDMLTVGKTKWYRRHDYVPLTADEQYTQVSWWCLLSAPLLIGCDLSQMDAFTYGLLSNDEVLDVDQDPLGRQAARISRNGLLEVWAKQMEDGSHVAGLFNMGSQASEVTATWQDLGINGKQIARDLWRQKDLGVFDGQFKAAIPVHGVVLVRFRPAGS
ncbi:MAG TPA: putative Ig domain-containing protein [Chthoniobacteraceae bacterium]|nr:putative Ig domain-containing protein [Chthoniobacteraceae bacterium]